MKLIKPSFEIWEQPTCLQEVYKQIEKAGRVCYKSEDKITDNSAKPFVDRMVKSGHGAMLEHGTVYLKVPNDELLRNFIDGIPSDFNYSWCSVNPIMDKDNNVYITTNFRHIIEHKLEDYLKYLCEPTEYHEKRVTVRFVCDRGVSHEFVRHRVFSFAQESTRYCNYSKDKFSNEVTFIKPCWVDVPEGKYTNISKQSPEDGEYKQIMLHENNINAYPLTTTPEGRFLWHCFWSEHDYFDLLEQGWKPQQAREVLPNACKTELVMTGFVSQWKDFFLLRSNKYGKGGAHPSADELATPLYEEFVARGYIE